MFHFSMYWGCHHPNRLSYFSEGLEPPTRISFYNRERSAQGMHEKPQPEGKPLLVTMGTRQPGEGKGKGKDGGWGAANFCIAGEGGLGDDI